MPSPPANSIIPDLLRKLRTACVGGLLAITALFAPAQPVETSYVFTHLAGPLGGPGNVDATGPVARFMSPQAVTVDGAGNLYVADLDNHTIRRITPAGVVSTLTGPDGVPLQLTPTAVAADSGGNVYVADANQDIIYRIAPGGLKTIFAGATYTHFYTNNHVLGDGRDGTGTDARFFQPSGLATDSAGNLYVADSGNNTIRRITPGGGVTTLAGFAGQSGLADGTGAAARFSYPTSVTVDHANNVYVGDAGTSVRKIAPDGTVTTVAGAYGQVGDEDGTGVVARFNRPHVAADGAGNVFVADSENCTIRLISPGGVVSTLAGQAGQRGGNDGSGAAARFTTPTGIVVDRTGMVFVADTGSFTIRRVAPDGRVTTLAGTAGGFGGIDATGASARFHFPQGVAVDAHDNVYVADFYNHAIRKVTPAGVVTTFAGVMGYSTIAFVSNGSASARFYYPSGIAVDASGNLYVAEAGTNSIRKITADGVVTTFAGPGGGYVFGHTDGPGPAAQFAYPEGIAVDPAGTVYVADTANNIIRKITPGGMVSTLAGTAGLPGSADGIGPAAQFSSPIALTADGAGTVYVADSYNHTIRKITASGAVTTLAGLAGHLGSADGTGAAARFSSPCGIAVDSAGNLFVGDSNNLTIRKVTPDGVVTTIGGQASVIGSADGLGPAASFYFPSSLAIDSAGTLYIADEYNHAIRKGQLAGPPVITGQPQSQTVAPGGSVQFSVAASSVLTPSYQWYVNGTSFSGATNSSLSFANARSTDAGDYTVVVTNELGSVISNSASLTVATMTTPPPAPTGTSGGGGAIEPWFALGLALFALGSSARAAHKWSNSAQP